MGDVVKFRRPPRNTGQFKGYRPTPVPGGPKGPKRKWGLLHSLLVIVGGAVAIYGLMALIG
ncbi:hypothetical protein [Novosphingobium aquimarinum]|uniref:hypothetical protein n=1 Tax=Novosphingobium aquimarinum TaxID=2682494 RepID=UPI0012ECA2A7|nr:hypothetical protein [Novosphingobium aquimarinum]